MTRYTVVDVDVGVVDDIVDDIVDVVLLTTI